MTRHTKFAIALTSFGLLACVGCQSHNSSTASGATTPTGPTNVSTARRESTNPLIPKNEEITVQGISIGSSFDSVQAAVNTPCPSSLLSQVSGALQLPFAYFDVRRKAYLANVEEPLEIALGPCLTVGGTKRNTSLTFAKMQPEAQDACRSTLRDARPLSEGGFEVPPPSEAEFKKTFLSFVGDRRLIKIRISFGEGTQTDFDELARILTEKYGSLVNPTDSDLELFNNKRSNELDYYFADFKVWLTVDNSNWLAVEYVNAETAGYLMKGRMAKTKKASDL